MRFGTTMNPAWQLCVVASLLMFVPLVAAGKSKPAKQWRALHLLNYNTDADLEALGQNLIAREAGNQRHHSGS